MRKYYMIGTVAISVLVLGSSYISAYNQANSLEQQIKATYKNNENILAQYGNKIQESTQVPAMQAQDLKDLFSGAITARYGKDGSQAAMQWLKEQNPNLNQETYLQLQRMIEAGRNDFKVNQTKLLDVKRTYETLIGSFWAGFWIKIAGYPKIILDDYTIVSTDRAEEAFKTKKEQPIKLR